MAEIKYKCDSCLKEFAVKYIFVKPGQVNCPHCGSPYVQEAKNSGCGCGGGNSGFRFT